MCIFQSFVRRIKYIYTFPVSRYDDVFPRSWHVSVHLTRQFGHVTRTHLEQLLTKLGNDLNVRVLLHVIQKTMEAEAEWSRRLLVGIVPQIPSSPVTSSSSSSSTAVASTQLPSSPPQSTNIAMSMTTFDKFVSGVFEPFMSLYLKLEEKNMRTLVDKLLREESWIANETKVLESSTELFLAIKSSLRQCAAITTSQTLVSLANIFEKSLRLYAEGLTAKIQSFG